MRRGLAGWGHALRRRLMLVLWGASCVVSGLATAQVRDVHIVAPRTIGWTVGDVIPFEIEMLVDADWRLETASLPQPGQRQYWLELRGIEHVSRLDGPVRRHRVRLLYQTFYVPIEARNLVLPGLRVEFTGPAPATAVEVPGWTFTMSPLRELTLGGGDGLMNVLRADAPAARLSEREAWSRLAVALSGCVLLALVLAWHYGAGPFATRRARPFAQAARRLRRLGRSGMHPADAPYREGMRLLHRAFDATAGARVLATDLETFVTRHPAFAGLREDIARFFQSSRAEFFDVGGERLSGEALVQVAVRLADAERAARQDPARHDVVRHDAIDRRPAGSPP